MPRKKIKLKKGQTVPDALVNPVKKSHGDTVRFIGGMRNAKNKMPRPIKKLFPDF